jgi:hypothetical protein
MTSQPLLRDADINKLFRAANGQFYSDGLLEQSHAVSIGVKLEPSVTLCELITSAWRRISTGCIALFLISKNAL